jgi:hypothetical protein
MLKAGDVGAICDPRPRTKRPGERVEIVAHLREQHRVARERHRDRRHQLEALAVLRREQ